MRQNDPQTEKRKREPHSGNDLRITLFWPVSTPFVLIRDLGSRLCRMSKNDPRTLVLLWA